MIVPSQSWFAEMRALDRANDVLGAQIAAHEAGAEWSVTIAPERRSGETVVVARCRCGYSSMRMKGAGAFERAARATTQHVRDAHPDPAAILHTDQHDGRSETS